MGSNRQDNSFQYYSSLFSLSLLSLLGMSMSNTCGLVSQKHQAILYFTVAPSKIKMETDQYTKSRIWEMKDDKYCKQRASPIFRFVRYFICKIFGKTFYPNLQSFVWRCHVSVPLRGTNMVARNQQSSVFEFSYKSVNTSLQEFTKIKVILFILRQGMFR